MRIQNNILAKSERRLLNLLCTWVPKHITPDHMTLVGLIGATAVLAGYGLSNYSRAFLWLAVAGYFLHWFGDSMDGSLARFRHIERPRYGYFTDHSTDALGNFMIMFGLGLSTYVRMDVSLFALCGYFLLSMYAFLLNKVLDTLQLSFIAFGPTELRLCLVAITLSMFCFGATWFSVMSLPFTIYDLVIGGAGAIFVTLFTWSCFGTSRQLRAEDRG
jgi:archaetidylinositol phosphate synthase